MKRKMGNGLRKGRWYFEIRCKVGNNIARVLYFFYYQGKIVLTNGFIKKTQKIPPEELRLAKIRRKEYVERMERE